MQRALWAEPASRYRTVRPLERISLIDGNRTLPSCIEVLVRPECLALFNPPQLVQFSVQSVKRHPA